MNLVDKTDRPAHKTQPAPPAVPTSSGDKAGDANADGKSDGAAAMADNTLKKLIKPAKDQVDSLFLSRSRRTQISISWVVVITVAACIGAYVSYELGWLGKKHDEKLVNVKVDVNPQLVLPWPTAGRSTATGWTERPAPAVQETGGKPR